MNVVRAFANYLTNIGIGTFGQDLFISRAPAEPNRIFWLKANGGSSVARSVTGQDQKAYVIEVFHRDTNTEAVYEAMQELADDITCAGCLALEGYEVVSVSINGPFTDQDLDNEERTVGFMQITLTIYKEC